MSGSTTETFISHLIAHISAHNTQQLKNAALTPPSNPQSDTKMYDDEIEISQDQPPPTATVTRFDARTIPQIKVQTYIQRILKYAPCQTDVLILVLIYLTRFKTQINAWNVHRILITTYMVAAKFSSDTFFTNLHYAKVGGLPTTELNKLEIEFLSSLDFNLGVTPAELHAAYESLIRHVMDNDADLEHVEGWREEMDRLTAQSRLYAKDAKVDATISPPTPPASPEKGAFVPSFVTSKKSFSLLSRKNEHDSPATAALLTKMACRNSEPKGWKNATLLSRS